MAGNTIVLKGMGHHDEGRLDEIVSPGHAIEQAADGDYDLPQGTQAELLKKISFKVAKEDALQGKTVDDAYAVGDIVSFYTPLPGDRIQVLVKSGEDIDVGDKLIIEAGGSGLWVEAAGTETRYQAEAIEDSGGALAANKLLSVRVI